MNYIDYNKITNPETGRKVSIYSKKGKEIIFNYVQMGGFIRGGVRIPADNYLDTSVNCDNNQAGGFMRGGIRIPADNYLDTRVKCDNVQTGGFMRGGIRIPPDNYLDTRVDCNHK